jgi:hypothetical protein
MRTLLLALALAVMATTLAVQGRPDPGAEGVHADLAADYLRRCETFCQGHARDLQRPHCSGKAAA